MRSVTKAVLWLAVFTVISVVCATVVITALHRPVRAPVARYAATFSDVSGLYVGDDVRISGVQVGKVETIALDGRNAHVDFTALADHPVYHNTTAAVRYQNLLGQRYIELVQPATPDTRLAAGAVIDLANTIPSFDITKLFNGFRPIFDTLDPAQFNLLGENLLRIIQGDETGVGPFLHDLDAISKLAVDRQAVLKVLITNLARIGHDLRGKSAQLFHLIAVLNDVLTKFTSRGTDFRAAIDEELPTLRNAVHILQYVERLFDGSTTPAYDLLARMFPQTPTIIAGLSLVPSLIGGMRDTLLDDKPARPVFGCSHGEVTLPGIGQVSFAQQNLVLCR
jgi:phospholipid/cholesterol/gamma-HCH transport system substrate-binding protein